ncbi:hypothetical protein AB0C87_19990 [Actinomadura sp. NPDC048021]|uniref:hypothetical protein n=1 Tax=Actinomadura sp. NPDC048021 TaxID=3155385 RepID=UPI0033E107E0
MALSDQANDPSSTLCAFLDAHRPHRGLVAKQWIRQMRRTPWAPIDIEADRRRLGIALELRTGLDLADEPAHWGLLADLVKGRTLVEIKASAEPAKHCDAWLNQLLGYLFLDHLDIFCWEAVAIYLGWHATTLSVSVQSLLVASSAGTTPALSDLRAEFRKVIADKLDEAASWHLRDRYPVPPVTSDDVRT